MLEVHAEVLARKKRASENVTVPHHSRMLRVLERQAVIGDGMRPLGGRREGPGRKVRFESHWECSAGA